jgi:hypothetical protein
VHAGASVTHGAPVCRVCGHLVIGEWGTPGYVGASCRLVPVSTKSPHQTAGDLFVWRYTIKKQTKEYITNNTNKNKQQQTQPQTQHTHINNNEQQSKTTTTHNTNKQTTSHLSVWRYTIVIPLLVGLCMMFFHSVYVHLQPAIQLLHICGIQEPRLYRDVCSPAQP